jgi:hypothetical protein
MIGFVFVNESEAKTFWKKVIGKKDAKSCESLRGRPALVY